VATRRIFAELQKLELHEIDREKELKIPVQEIVEPSKAAKQPKTPKARNTPQAATEGAGTPREGTKLAQVIELARRPTGVTLDQVMAFGWQKHTARALMSAGGMITKKYGIPVISEKVGDVRTYRIEAGA
jgi:hypothetical protein